ncbi:unnamed protein product [Pylaiella littoralis]
MAAHSVTSGTRRRREAKGAPGDAVSSSFLESFESSYRPTRGHHGPVGSSCPRINVGVSTWSGVWPVSGRTGLPRLHGAGLNVAECDFDGGDCCECECNEDAFYECGRAGFVCEDPDAVTTCTDLDDSSMSFFYYDDGDFDDDISGQTCDNGLQGVANKDVCCVLECGQCGGPGCSSIAGLTGDDCCTANIETNGELCSATGAAPCLMGKGSIVLLPLLKDGGISPNISSWRRNYCTTFSVSRQ